jgi:hypothetical protein
METGDGKMRMREGAKGKDKRPGISTELEKMKPSYSMEVPLGSLPAKKRAESAQEIAGLVENAVKSCYPNAAGGCSAGYSGSIWNLNTREGRARVSYNDEKDDRVRIDFFRFEPGSDVVKAVKAALQRYL